MPSPAYPTRLFRSLWPPARSPFSWRTAISPAIFILLYGGLIIAVEAGEWMRFTWKPAFGLMLAVPWLWWLHVAGGSGLRGWRAQAALHSRLWLVGLFVALLAEPRAVRKSDALSVVYAVDVSDSIGQEAGDRSLEWVSKSAAQKPRKDEAGLVVFARDAAVELPPRKTFPFDTIHSVVPKDASDLATGLRMAAAILPEGNPGRIVLISDGNQTDGEVLSAVDELKARRIAVDVLGIDFDLQKEVWIERLDLPRGVKRGETYNASIVLSALQGGHGKLRLSENGKEIGEEEVDYSAGKNRYLLPLPQRGPGYYEYAASIEVPRSEDFWDGNNRAINDLYIKGEGRILVATDAHSDAREWESLVEALKAGERSVQVRMGYEMPRDPLSLLPYDLIVIPNAPADAFDSVQMQAMHDAVFHLGSGLLMLGSEHTFGPGGYRHTVIEDALPVEMDVSQKKVLPSGALLIVLDSSGSMSAPVAGRTKIALADHGAVLALKTLNEQDYFGVFSVDTQANAVIPMGQHGALKEADAQKVLRIGAGGGGIYIYTSLAEAVLAFRGVNTNIKHVILFADAADAEQQTADTHPDAGIDATTALDLASAMSAAKITISVVALGTEADKDTAFLRELAARGQGRFYLTNDATNLPQIFIKEAITLKRTMLQNRTFVPEAVFPSPILKGIESMPPLHGYVLTTPKTRASVVLQAPPDAEGATRGESPDPLLATWRYGLGTAAAWTSDFAPNWGRDWMAWEKQRAFLKQLVTGISRVSARSNLDLTASENGSQASITIEDSAPQSRFLNLHARVFGPRQESREIALQQVAPRRYQGHFTLWGQGRYQIAAAAEANSTGATEQAIGGLAVSYSPEYRRFKSDSRLLQQIARRTGGRMLSADDVDLYHPPRQVRESSTPVFDGFLFLLACLVPLDVAVRRVQLDWTAMAGWFQRDRSSPSTEMMSALLERKKQVYPTAPDKARPVLLKISPPSPTQPAQTNTDKSPSPAETNSAEANEPTTSRLLARKRHRQTQEGS